MLDAGVTVMVVILVFLLVGGLVGILVWLLIFKPQEEETKPPSKCTPESIDYLVCCNPSKDTNCICDENNDYYPGCKENPPPPPLPPSNTALKRIVITSTGPIELFQVYVFDENQRNVAPYQQVIQNSTVDDFYFPLKYQAKNAIDENQITLSKTTNNGIWSLDFSVAMNILQVSIITGVLSATTVVTLNFANGDTEQETLSSSSTTTIRLTLQPIISLPKSQCLLGVYSKENGACIIPIIYPDYWNNCVVFNEASTITDNNKYYCQNDNNNDPLWTHYITGQIQTPSGCFPGFYKGICQYNNEGICFPSKDYGRRFIFQVNGTNKRIVLKNDSILSLNDPYDSQLRVLPLTDNYFQRVFQFNGGALQESMSGLFTANTLGSLIVLSNTSDHLVVFISKDNINQVIDIFPSSETSFYIRETVPIEGGSTQYYYWNLDGNDYVSRGLNPTTLWNALQPVESSTCIKNDFNFIGKPGYKNDEYVFLR